MANDDALNKLLESYLKSYASLIELYGKLNTAVELLKMQHDDLKGKLVHLEGVAEIDHKNIKEKIDIHKDTILSEIRSLIEDTQKEIRTIVTSFQEAKTKMENIKDQIGTIEKNSSKTAKVDTTGIDRHVTDMKSTVDLYKSNIVDMTSKLQPLVDLSTYIQTMKGKVIVACILIIGIFFNSWVTSLINRIGSPAKDIVANQEKIMDNQNINRQFTKEEIEALKKLFEQFNKKP